MMNRSRVLTLLERLDHLTSVLADPVEWRGRDATHEMLQLAFDDLAYGFMKYSQHLPSCQKQGPGTCDCGLTAINQYLREDFLHNDLTPPPVQPPPTLAPLRAYRKAEVFDVVDLRFRPADQNTPAHTLLVTNRGEFRMKVNLDTLELVLEEA